MEQREALQLTPTTVVDRIQTEEDTKWDKHL